MQLKINVTLDGQEERDIEDPVTPTYLLSHSIMLNDNENGPSTNDLIDKFNDLIDKFSALTKMAAEIIKRKEK